MLFPIVLLLVGIVATLISFQLRAKTVALDPIAEGSASVEHADINLGPSDIVLPNFVGEAIAVALEAIADLGLQAETVELEPDEVPEAEPGSVVSQTPEVGTVVDAETIIVLQATPESLQIPDVLELDAATAEQELRGLGFQVQQLTSSSPSRNPNEVFAINPGVGHTAEPGSTVTIFVAEEPTRTAPDRDVDADREILDLVAEDYVFQCLAYGMRGLGVIHEGQPSEGEKLARILAMAFEPQGTPTVVDLEHAVPGTMPFANVRTLCGASPEFAREVIRWGIEWFGLDASVRAPQQDSGSTERESIAQSFELWYDECVADGDPPGECACVIGLLRESTDRSAVSPDELDSLMDDLVRYRYDDVVSCFG